MVTSTSNPWTECLLHGDGTFERRFLAYTLLYIFINNFGLECQDRYEKYYHDAHIRWKSMTTGGDGAVVAGGKSRPKPSKWLELVASRPTVLAATLHAVATSIISVGILVMYYWNYNNDVSSSSSSSSPWIIIGSNPNVRINLIQLWQTVGLPISLSYFITDSYYYCYPKRDGIIFIHHIIMCFCHYPIACTSGATLAGAGNAHWATWLSIVGYTSEVSTAVMNYRWYLINTLEENWFGFGIVNCIVVLSWAGRVVLFTYLLLVEIYPRYTAYMEYGQLFTYAVLVFGHAAIGLLSLYWCIVMCRGGLKSLFIFETKKSSGGGAGGGLTFAEEVSGRKRKIQPPVDRSIEEVEKKGQ
jgi:hypothetical protein